MDGILPDAYSGGTLDICQKLLWLELKVLAVIERAQVSHAAAVQAQTEMELQVEEQLLQNVQGCLDRLELDYGLGGRIEGFFRHGEDMRGEKFKNRKMSVWQETDLVVSVKPMHRQGEKP